MRLHFETIIISFVYFIAGAVSLAGVAATFFYKNDLQLTITQVQLLASVGLIPWSIKPIYGFFSDNVPIFGSHRKAYLILAGILGSLGYFCMALLVKDFTGALIATTISAVGFALADVTVDGIVAERSRTQKEAGKLQSICRASLMLGALVVAYASGVLVEKIGARNVFYVTAFLPLCTSILALWISDTFANLDTFSWRILWQKIRTMFSKSFLFAVAFLFVWRATPSSGGAFSYFLIDELHFTAEFFGRLSLISNITAIIGILVFRKFLLGLSLRKLFFWVVILSILLSLPSIALVEGWYKYFGVSAKFFALADTAVAGVLQEIGFLPLLVFAARLCPKGFEATAFAILASIMNIGMGVSDALGAWLTSIFDIHGATATSPGDYTNLAKVMWIAILSSALPLPLLRYLPETRVSEEIDAGAARQSDSPIAQREVA